MPPTGVDELGVGAFELFLELSLCPLERKCDETALAPAAALVDVGAMLS
jgi:hypothetical protein